MVFQGLQDPSDPHHSPVRYRNVVTPHLQQRTEDKDPQGLALGQLRWFPSHLSSALPRHRGFLPALLNCYSSHFGVSKLPGTNFSVPQRPRRLDCVPTERAQVCSLISAAVTRAVATKASHAAKQDQIGRAKHSGLRIWHPCNTHFRRAAVWPQGLMWEVDGVLLESIFQSSLLHKEPSLHTPRPPHKVDRNRVRGSSQVCSKGHPQPELSW